MSSILKALKKCINYKNSPTNSPKTSCLSIWSAIFPYYLYSTSHLIL